MKPDPIEKGLRAGWHAVDASTLTNNQVIDVDVAIVGTGAGGGTAAEILSRSGLRVALIEEGPLKTTSDFHMKEAEAYPDLYQESAARKTSDKSITILQGRCVGGGTTVNWTASFRTPPMTLAFWREHLGLSDLTPEALAPWFEMAEQRLSMSKEHSIPNRNNALLATGAERLGAEPQIMRRNVKNCMHLGYCGMGCPVGAKQSMLVTTIPTAMGHGAMLYSRLRAQRLVLNGDHADALECVAMDPQGIHPRDVTVGFRARHFIVAGGAIGSPALLLRSGAPDPYKHLGRGTFLHPTVVSIAKMPEPVHPFSGAPQSVYSDYFLRRDSIDGPIGFKLEVPPVHPVIAAITATGIGEAHASFMRDLPNAHVIVALMRDGFHPESRGGTVSLRSDGTPVLTYPFTPAFWDAARRAFLTMAEMQFAAGAREVIPIHEQARAYRSWDEARSAIEKLELKPLATRVVSAHVMGGCAMGAQADSGVVDTWGRHFQLSNVSVFDGSVFPTSVGANPQLSIYGLTARNASRLAETLTGRPAARLSQLS